MRDLYAREIPKCSLKDPPREAPWHFIEIAYASCKNNLIPRGVHGFQDIRDGIWIVLKITIQNQHTCSSRLSNPTSNCSVLSNIATK